MPARCASLPPSCRPEPAAAPPFKGDPAAFVWALLGTLPKSRSVGRTRACPAAGRTPGPGSGRCPEGGATVGQQVNAAAVDWNPTAERLRELTEKMPNASVTEFGNVNVRARVDSRSTRSTFIVEDSTNAT